MFLDLVDLVNRYSIFLPPEAFHNVVVSLKSIA